ncbi:MAG: aspartyl/glutamyl-tRNA(Asn/Gln) amidotransferase subunit B [Cyclobacteriaceae bacterium]|nr:MAG: aspartyl/glutamyl-tRNA(Asn/Gln) amidotransferase subunit B [Cyclobacteriaceae bacterium]
MAHTVWQPVIGLELHVQLNTRSKLFCSDEVAFGGEPNTRISEISLGYPGTLPRLNKEAVRKALLLSLACGSNINTRFYFERKNYTYPDLPKGYQLTQSRMPVCQGGSIPVRLNGRYARQVPLVRIQLEEDAGKSLHDVYQEFTALDFNRAGTPLLEVVTAPAIHTPEEAGAVVAELRRMVRYLDISDGNMEEASLRCDANISLRQAGTDKLGTRVEIKNLNSIRFLQQALAFEIQRQEGLLNRSLPVVQETRLFDPDSGETFAMRTKEDLNDYRYFPEPDLPPVALDPEWIAQISQSVPEMPALRYERYISRLDVPEAEAALITEELRLANLFDLTVTLNGNTRKVANWVAGPVRNTWTATGNLPAPHQLAGIITLVESGKVSFSVAAQQLLPHLTARPGYGAEEAASELGIIQTAQEEVILPHVHELLSSFPDKVNAYRKGEKRFDWVFYGRNTKAKRQPV